MLNRNQSHYEVGVGAIVRCVADEDARDILIHGPTIRGTFFLADPMGNVWDGEYWRGFGHPMEFDKFRLALIETRKAERA